MYTVMLVDDEKNVLETLMNSIDWMQLGVEHVITAAGGEEALEIFEKQPVDLLVTDIRMPRVDGLTLISNVRSLYPNTHCILLTAYSEFEYAKKAIGLGVENYLLKPFSIEEVVQTVHNALDNIYHHRESSESLLRENTLRRWINANIGAEELGERGIVLGLNLYLPEYCVICMVKRRTEQSISVFLSRCTEKLTVKYELYHLWDERGRYILILGGKHIDSYNIENDIEAIAKDCDASNYVIAALGPVVQETSLLHTSYHSACDMLVICDVSDKGIMCRRETQLPGMEADEYSEEIRQYLYETNKQKSEEIADRIAMLFYKASERSDMNRALSMLIRTCMRVLSTELQAQTWFRDSLFQQAYYKEFIPGRDEFFEVAHQELLYATAVFDRYFTELSPIIQHTIRFIRESVNMGNSISLKEFCNKTCMNPAYLGHLFKKETGAFFNDYLAYCRINRSLLLLRQTDKKIKDIAVEVGFMSTSYFVKCFKEYKGVSPARYRMDTLLL